MHSGVVAGVKVVVAVAVVGVTPLGVGFVVSKAVMRVVVRPVVGDTDGSVTVMTARESIGTRAGIYGIAPPSTGVYSGAPAATHDYGVAPPPAREYDDVTDVHEQLS